MGHQINDSYGSISFNHKCNRIGLADRFIEGPQKINIENKVIKETKSNQPKELNIVKSIPGVGNSKNEVGYMVK